MARVWEYTYPPRVERLDDKSLVESWISMHRESWFNNPTNGLYCCAGKAKAVAEYWLKHGEHGTDYNDHALIYLMNSWDEYVEMYTRIDNDDATDG